MNFEDIGINEDFIARLKMHLKSKRLSKCYILSGPKSRNGLDVALGIAKTVNCIKDADSYCDTCKNCRMITKGSHPDVQVYASKKTRFGIDLVKKVQTDSTQTNYSATYRVNILKDAQGMTIPAQNALLKTLEDSLSDCVTIMLTESTSTILDTIKSRSILLNLPPLIKEKAVSMLVEKDIDKDSAEVEYDESSGDIDWLIWALENKEKCERILSSITRSKDERTIAIIESTSNEEYHDGFRYLLPQIVSKALLVKNGVAVQSRILSDAVKTLACENADLIDELREEVEKAEKLWNTGIRKATLLQKIMIPLMI